MSRKGWARVTVERATEEAYDRHTFRLVGTDPETFGAAVAAALESVAPRPLAVVAAAVEMLDEGSPHSADPREGALAKALCDAALAYLEFWRQFDRKA